MTVLSARGVCVERGGVNILDKVTIGARDGEFIAVIGPNGAGKSTLLSVLAGLLAPDAGEILLNDASIAQLPRAELARMRAYLPQSPRCEWPISVERLVALGLTPTLPAFGNLPVLLQRRVEAALETFDLSGRREQAATTLSGGELARAMMARALVGDPGVIVVDEPLTGLDPRHALDMCRRLQELAKSGKLVVASIHDLTLVARYATRVIALDRGTVAADGSVDQVLTPAVLRSTFHVDARVVETAGGKFVDYLAEA